MKRIFVVLVCLGCWIITGSVRADPPASEEGNRDFIPAQKFSPVFVAGSTRKDAEAIAERLRQRLISVPHIEIAFLKRDEISIQVVVYTSETGEKPTTLPVEVTALPSVFEGIPVKIDPLYVLPPPADFIVLKPDFEYEHANACPPEYYETESKGWRFCNSHGSPQPIPPIMALPVAGIPYMKALKIVERHRETLRSLPGVASVGLGNDGIIVEAPDSSLIPKEIEGLPVEVHPVKKRNAAYFSHTISSQVRPIGGAMKIGVESGFLTSRAGSLMAVGHNACGLWLVFPAHLVPTCGDVPPCTGPLSGCLNRYSSSNPTVEQPPTFPLTPLIGQVVTWGLQRNNQTSWDVAAAWLDNDTNQGNSSIGARRWMEGWSNSDWGGEEEVPVKGQNLLIITPRAISGSSTHVLIPATVDNFLSVDRDVPLTNLSGCSSGGPINPILPHAVTMHSSINHDDYFLRPGDSGSPILTAAGKLVSMVNAADVIINPDGSTEYDGTLYGHLAVWVRSFLGLDRWYGTAKFPDHPQVCQ